jgi:hypothetical protein
LQNKVAEIAERRGKGFLYDIRKQHARLIFEDVEKKIQQEALEPDNQRKLQQELEFENKKAQQAAKREAGAMDRQPRKRTKKQAAPIKNVITVLFIFQKTDQEAKEAGIKKSRAKKQFALTLWEDGPAVSDLGAFRGTSVLTEYRHAAERKDLQDCDCVYCEPLDPDAPTELEKLHAVWHNKFRSYYALRAAKFPTYVDGSTTIAVINEELVMYYMVLMWKQVDPRLPYFRSLAYVTYKEEGQELVAVAAVRKKKTEQAAARRALKKTQAQPASVSSAASSSSSSSSISNLGLRVPREYNKLPKYTFIKFCMHVCLLAAGGSWCVYLGF